MVFADIISLVAGSADSGYKEFKAGDFAEKALKVYSKLNQINEKYLYRDNSPATMKKYQNTYFKILKIFASFACSRIEQLSINN